MKGKLTTEQHWKMIAVQAMMREAQASMQLAQEAAGHLHTRLGIAQKQSDQAKEKRNMMAKAAKAEFIQLGQVLGAEGNPDTWKIHLGDDPSESMLEWEPPKEDKGKKE